MARNFDEEVLQELNDLLEQLKTGHFKEPKHVSLFAKKIAYYFALMKYNGIEEKEAFKMAEEISNKELAKICKINVDKKMEDAARCVRKYFFKDIDVDDSFEDALNGFYKDGRPVDKERADSFLKEIGAYLHENLGGRNGLEHITLDMAEELHNKWVLENVTDLETDPTDENLFRHLPFELVGFRELADSLLFVIPIVDKMNLYCAGIGPIDAGYDAHANDSLEIKYRNKVDEFEEKLKINSNEEFLKQLPNLIKEYESLNPKNAPKGQKELFKKRLEYMLSPEKLSILAKQVKEQNIYEFGERFDDYEFYRMINK